MKNLAVLLACLSIAAGTRGDLRKRYGEPIFVTYQADGGKTIDAPRASQDLRQKYGEPISETYQAQPGIRVTASYKPDGTFKELKVALESMPPPPPPPTIDAQGHETRTIDDPCRSIVDRLVPEAERGEYDIGGFFNIFGDDSSRVRSYGRYANLTIEYHAGGGIPPFYLVRWK